MCSETRSYSPYLGSVFATVLFFVSSLRFVSLSFQWRTCDYEIRLIESIIIAELLPDNLESRSVGLHLCGRPCCDCLVLRSRYILTAQLVDNFCSCHLV